MPHVEPHRWQPPPPRVDPHDTLAAPTLWDVGGTGPEDVLVDHEGRVITGAEDGRVLRIGPDGRRDTIADTGGRPLGIETLPDGDLLVCDATRGLLRIDPDSGDITTLVAPGGEHAVALCNNAAVAADGTVYFSDSSQRFPLAQWRADLMEHSGTGRLLRRDPDGTIEVLLDGLHFANGVALAADESFVTVAETGAYRLTRHWLRGPRQGSTDTFIDGLAGFPDNISTGPHGTIWVTQASPRNAMLDWSHAHAPWLLRLVARLPESWQLQPAPIVWVLGLDDQGQVVRDLRTTHPGFDMVTGVREHDNTLYLGSLKGSAIAVAPLTT